MADDIVTRLCRHGSWLITGEWTHDPLCRDAANAIKARDAEIERLRRWKNEATVVIEEWEAVWEAAGKPGGLGQSKPLGLMAALGRLDDEIERLREKGDALAALPVPCECDHDNVCRWCTARIDWETIRLG